MPKRALLSAMEGHQRQLMIDLLHQRPELKLGELLALARGELGATLRSITIAELLGPGRARSASPASARRQSGAGHAPAGKAAAKSVSIEHPRVNTHTAAGREAFDKKLLQAVTAFGGSASATQVQARVGGTNMQVRTGLNRLIEAGLLTWLGQARGTRYHAV